MANPHPKIATPWYFWAVAVLAIVWNGLGIVLWGGTTFTPTSFLEGMPQAHRDYVSSLPLWSTFTWGLGVIGGTAGSILLLLRHRLSVPVFAASLFGAVTNSLVYVTNPPPPGFFNPGLTLFITGFALFLLWFAHSRQQR